MQADHGGVEEVAGVGDGCGRQRSPTPEDHSAVGGEPPVEEEVLGVDEHAVPRAHRSGHLGIEHLGGDDVRPDRHHPAAQPRHQAVGIRVGGDDHDGRRHPPAVRGDLEAAPAATRALLESEGGGAVVDVGTGLEGQPNEAGVELRRLQSTRALDDDATEERGRPDLVGQLVAGHPVHRFAEVAAVLGGHRPESGDVGAVVGQVQLAGARVVAVDLLFGDERLDVVERVVDLVVEATAGRPVLLLQRARSGLELGDDHAAVPGAGPDADRIAIDHDDRATGAGQLPAGSQAAVACAHDHHVDLCGEGVRLDGRRVGLGLPEDPFLVGGGQGSRGDRTAGHVERVNDSRDLLCPDH